MSHLLKVLTPSLLLALLLGLLPACKPATNDGSSPSLKTSGGIAEESNRNIRFGMPGKATKDSAHREAYLIDRPQYVLSYNDVTKNPNWVSWQLLKEDCPGKAERGPFHPDALLPKSFVHVTEAAYSKSGFDRGHMCPSADRSDTQENNDATFFMTNIIPQAPNVNRKGWERMETYCRNLVKQGKELLICCGPHGTGGDGSDGTAKSIGSGKAIINVPATCWKIVMVLPEKGAVPNDKTRVIAVVMPNSQEADLNWTKYRVTAKEIENMTALTFFPNVPAAIADHMKSRVDDTQIHVEPFKSGKK